MGTTIGDQQVPNDGSVGVSAPAEPYTYADHVSNSMAGADIAAQEQGSKSIFDTGSDIVTKAVPLVGAAIANSFYNTAVEVGNFMGADVQKASIENEFGPDSDTTAYYQQHSGAIEGTALAVGSLLPGLGATKLLRLAQLGKFGSTMQMSTGLFSGIRDAAVKTAADDMVGNAAGSSLFGLSAVNKTKAILAGVGDQALQGAVYETATLATMHASPITDNNTLGDNISDVISTAKGFAVVGGIVDGASNLFKIRSAIRATDMATKDQEAFGSLGLGNLTPGDRVVKLYQTMDNIQGPTNTLGTMKASITKNTTNRLIQQELIKAAGGDEELAGSFRNFLETGREAGSIGPQEITDNLGQLSKIGRHGDTSVASQPSDVFYIPKSIDANTVSTATHDDLMQKIATGPTEAARALTLKNPTLLPTIGRSTDNLSFIGTNGSTVSNPAYNGAMDAYKKGVDIYLDANGGTHINPNSTAFSEVARPGESRILDTTERAEYLKSGNLPAGSKPLNAVGLTLDVTNGKLYGESPLAVVGDIAKPSTYGIGGNGGLRVGDSLFPQTTGKEFVPTSPLDANARYVWASMRGIKNSDAIAPNDLPMMEQLYREKVAGFDHEDFSHTFTDGSDIPEDAGDLLQHIADTKAGMYADLLSQGKNADEIGHILNAPTSGLTKNFNTTNPDELIIPPSQSANIKHVRLAYDIGTTKDSQGNLLRGMQATNYRMKLAADTNSNQVANYLASTVGKGDKTGKLANQFFSSLQFTKGAQDADIAGAGSTFIAHANAAYGSMAQQAERMGRAGRDLSTLRHSVVSDTLAPSSNALRSDYAAAAEYSVFRTVRQSTGESYVFLPDDVAAANKLPSNTAVLEGAIGKDKNGNVTYNPSYLPNGFVDGSDTTTKGLKSYYSLSPKVADFERANMALNNPRNQLRSDWWSAQGINKPVPNPDRLYTPPINGAKYPFMAYVRQREGYALGESGASIITARTAEELQTKIASLGPEYDAFTKSDIANFKKAQGEYEFNRNFMNNKANTEMARKGILNNVTPETRPQNLIDDAASWHFNQEDQLLRDHIELHNAATFDQLKAMGDRFDQTGTSRFGAITPFMQRTATNPYQSYIRTALGLSAKDNYPLWQLAQEKLEAFAGTAFNTAKATFGAVQKGLLPVEDAVKLTEKMGLGNPYGTALDQITKNNYYGGLANQLPDPGIFRKFIATANSALGATVIRLDTFQQLIHAVTMPIMVALEHSSATDDLRNLMNVSVPGTATFANQAGLQVPGLARSLYNGVKNYFTDYEARAAMYSGTGMTRDELNTHQAMINELSMPLGKLSESGWAQKINNGTSYAEKLTGTKFTNSFIHFMVSDVGRQIGEAQGQTGQDLLDTIGTFANRSLGNISAGQRAGIFQGPVGQAIGLFQSYQWNMMQQLLRHIGDGDIKALAMGTGMQSSIFGISSLPGFQALNSMIADRHGNTQGADLYSSISSMLPGSVPNASGGNSSIADYLLYGSLSGLTGQSLYSRGDLNPRRATILPINPLQMPSVAAGIRVYSMLSQLGENITTKGGNVPASLLLAAEHNGLSRPLTGLAELAQGFTTSGNGNLVSKVSGLSDLGGIATMSRILGARPLDESVAMDAMYRSNALKVLDTARLQELGSTLKTALYNNSQLAPEDAQSFMANYVKAGGTQTNFNSWFLQQAKSANVSVVNRVFENFHNPRSQALQETMGGVPLPDFRQSASVQPSSIQPEQTQ